MFYLDTPTAITTAGAANSGYTARKGLHAGGKSCQLYGRLRCGFFKQPLLLPPGLDLRVKLTFAPESFYMWSTAEDDNINLRVTDATLYCKNVIVSAPLLMSHSRILAQTHAIFPMKRVETKSFTMAPGTRNISLNNVCTGRLPTFLCLAMINNSAFNGNRQLNSFALVHKSVTNVSIFVNAQEHKIGPLDFHSGEPYFARAYYDLFSSTGADKRSTPHMITPEMFSHGTFLVCKDLSPDSSGNTAYANIPNNGTVRIEIAFANGLTEALTIIVFLEFDSLLEIDASRNLTIS
jgi:hypothetical protein